MFVLAPTTLKAGETLVFAPDQDGGRYSVLNYAQNNSLARSRTGCDQNTNAFDLMDELNSPPGTFFEDPDSGKTSGSDNLLMGLKYAPGNGAISDRVFDLRLQQICYINTSLQAGGSDEIPVRWNSRTPVRIQRLSSYSDKLPSTMPSPDVRTREGFRLRWWREHESNQRHSSRLRSYPEHLESSVIATWNPRAAYTCRDALRERHRCASLLLRNLHPRPFRPGSVLG